MTEQKIAVGVSAEALDTAAQALADEVANLEEQVVSLRTRLERDWRAACDQ